MSMAVGEYLSVSSQRDAEKADIERETTELAEERGFHVLHGIVDSLWLEGGGDGAAFCSDVTRRIGIPLQLEGVYRWIVFLPNVSTGVGALNRYYGLYDHDEFKLRGIELRKHDTPEFINICQEAMLGELSRASNAARCMV